MILNKELHIKKYRKEEMFWNEKNMLELLNVKKLFASDDELLVKLIFFGNC